ncbi:MAG: T9SS type A sorting domain-containing protein, partial [Bacteroidota bacterium]
EQIFTEEAPAGTYTVRVSHKATLHNNAPQSFSLLLTGIERAKTSVEIDSAYAEPAIGSTMVTWETLVENRPGHFIIERSHAESTSAISGALSRQFAKVVELPGRGNTAAGTTYAYSDAVYLTGQYVYRILFVGADTGTRTLLRELEVAVPAPMSFAIQTIFPNPAIDETQVVVDLPEELALTYAAFDLLGRMVVTPTKAALGAGRHFIPFDTATWAPGIYFIRISAGQQHLVRKLVVM